MEAENAIMTWNCVKCTKKYWINSEKQQLT